MSEEIKRNISESDLEKVAGGNKDSIVKDNIDIVGKAIASSRDDRRGWDDHVYDHEGP